MEVICDAINKTKKNSSLSKSRPVLYPNLIKMFFSLYFGNVLYIKGSHSPLVSAYSVCLRTELAEMPTQHTAGCVEFSPAQTGNSEERPRELKDERAFLRVETERGSQEEQS